MQTCGRQQNRRRAQRFSGCHRQTGSDILFLRRLSLVSWHFESYRKGKTRFVRLRFLSEISSRRMIRLDDSLTRWRQSRGEGKRNERFGPRVPLLSALKQSVHQPLRSGVHDVTIRRQIVLFCMILFSYLEATNCSGNPT